MRQEAKGKAQQNMFSVRDALCALAGQYDLAAVYAFGSRAAEVAARVAGEDVEADSPQSDIDIGVLPLPGCDLPVEDRVGLMQTLEDLFGVARVDLVILPEADPFLAANAIRGERLYVEDEYRADEYDLYVLRRAGDLVPLERERMALILGERV
jgi:predicted nucleotidyltransferase